MVSIKRDKSDAPSPKTRKSGGRLGNLSTWERIGGVIAILLAFFSFYLLISFTSFFITGSADISLLDTPLKELFSNPDLKMENAGGRFGAVLANLFINKGFGVASLGFIYLFLLLPCVWVRLVNFRFVEILPTPYF